MLRLMDETQADNPNPQPPDKQTRPPFGLIAIVIVTVLCLVALMLPVTSGRRGPSRQMQCLHNMAGIAISLDYYRKQNGHYPPAVIRDLDQPPLSWRVELLSYFDQPELEKRYDRRANWSSAINQPVRDTVLNLFICPNAAYQSPPGPRTDYVVVTGPGTAFPPGRTTGLSDIKDLPNQTVVLIEIPESKIYWCEPRDIFRKDAVKLFERLKADPTKAPHTGGFNVGMADGRVRFVELDRLTSAQFDGLLTIAGGEPPTGAF